MNYWRDDLAKAALDWLSVAGGEETPARDHPLMLAMLAEWPEATLSDIEAAFAVAQRESRCLIERLPLASAASA